MRSAGLLARLGRARTATPQTMGTSESQMPAVYLSLRVAAQALRELLDYRERTLAIPRQPRAHPRAAEAER